jgi:hypothetical protein
VPILLKTGTDFSANGVEVVIGGRATPRSHLGFKYSESMADGSDNVCDWSGDTPMTIEPDGDNEREAVARIDSR